MLIALPPTVSISDALRFIKANSSGWMHDKWPAHASFAWQLGFGAFSVGKSNVSEIVTYIQNQEEHHRRFTFQQEFLGFLRKYEIEYDERYIWE
jgi:REP element-mobilizing transposase RayT